MGKIPKQKIKTHEVLNNPLPGGQDDFLTLSLKRKRGSDLPPAFPTCETARKVVRELLRLQSNYIEEVNVLSPEEGWVKVRDSSLTLCLLGRTFLAIFFHNAWYQFWCFQ